MRHAFGLSLLLAAALPALGTDTSRLQGASNSRAAAAALQAKLHIQSATATLACPGEFFVTARIVNQGGVASAASDVVAFAPVPPGVDAWLNRTSPPMMGIYGQGSVAAGAGFMAGTIDLRGFLQPFTYGGREIRYGCCSTIPVEVKVLRPKGGGFVAAPDWDGQVFKVTAAHAPDCRRGAGTRLETAVPTPVPTPVKSGPTHVVAPSTLPQPGTGAK